MKKKPNVVIIMSDQHHPEFMGCGKDPIVRTPAIDSIAAHGCKFDNAYCPSPLCGPSRMAFMSGQLPSATGCLDNARALSSDTVTFAHMFGHCGYETVLAGRMHFNGPDQRHGFDKRIISDVTPNVYVGMREMMSKTLDNGPWYTGPQAESIRKSGPGKCSYEQYDQHVAKAAGDWISQRESDQPFMLTVGFVLPHAPFVASEEDFDAYDKLVSEEDLPVWETQTHPELKRFQDESRLNDEPRVSLKDQRRARVAYYGMCASVDRQVKVVLDALQAKSLTEDTIIVYTSDHGEQLGEHGLWWKHTFYESSVGVPLVMCGPGVPKNMTIKQNVSLMDIGQTVLDLAGCELNPTAQGKSFKCLMDGNAGQWHDTVISENLWPHTANCLQRMVKKGPWKLNHYHGFEPQLFNLDNDPQEQRDLAADPQYADRLAELQTIAIRDFDHDAILKGQKTYLSTRGILSESIIKSDMPEPDAVWHANHKIENFVDTSR